MPRKSKRPRSIKQLANAIQRQTLESIWEWGGYDFGGSDLIRYPRSQDEIGGWVPPSTPADRRRGQNWPLWRTEFELNRLRGASRLAVSQANAYGRCLLKNLTNSVIGKGFAYKAVLKDKYEPGPDDEGQDDGRLDGMLNAVQGVVVDFRARNRWNGESDPQLEGLANGTKEREAFRRTRRDGDTFIRLFYQDEMGPNYGRTLTRFMEPECCLNPPGHSPAEGWTFGLRHKVEPFEDLEDIQEYFFFKQAPDQRTYNQMKRRDLADQLGEFVPARELVHIKNVDEDANTKRGLPDFIWDTLDALVRASKLQKCISVSSAVRAATAEVWQHTVGTNAQITSLAAGLADKQVTDPLSGKTENVEFTKPGTRRRIPQGQQLVPPAATTQVTEHLAAAQGDLAQGSAAFCAPKAMTGDSSDVNLAAAKEAGMPWTRDREADQEHFKGAFCTVIWRAIRWAVECSILPPEVLIMIKIQVEAPAVTTADPLAEAQVAQILVPLKVTSPQTVQMQMGLDPDTEQSNFDDIADRQGNGSALQMPGDDDPNADPSQDDSGLITVHRQNGKTFTRHRSNGTIPEGRLFEWDENQHKRNKGQFATTTGGADPHDEAAHTIITPSFLAKMKKLPGAVANKAKAVVQGIYDRAEKKYGPKWAKAIMATAIITMPTPFTMGAVAAMTGLAHVYTKYAKAKSGAVKEGAEPEMSHEEIHKAAQAFLKEIMDKLGGDLEEGQWFNRFTRDDLVRLLEKFDEEKHPRGQPDNAGEFGPGGGGGGKKTKSTAVKSGSGTAVAEAPSLKIKSTKQRAFDGKQVPVKNQISKQAAGKIGEDIVIAWLHAKGMTDARHMNLDRNNFPIDLIQDHACLEVKTGNVANGAGAQQWRLTIGEPGKKEKEWLAQAGPEEKAAWNQKKQLMILERKKKALADLSEKLGKPIKARTITCLINPDTKTIDIYQFDGWHDRIGWNSESAKKAYQGSITYE